MEYRIVEQEEFIVSGFSKKVYYNNNTIPMFWNELVTNGKIAELDKIQGSKEMLGLCVMKKDYMDYYVGIKQETGYETIKVPAGRWIVFPVIGKMPLAIQKAWDEAMKYLKTTDFIIKNEFSYEYYSDGDVDAEDYYSEVWICIK